jgi:DNA polymerase
MHEDTEIISCAYKAGNGPVTVVFGEQEVIDAVRGINWADKIAVGHNMSGFDSMIMAWRIGVDPALWACTQAMATSKYKKTCGVSLKALAKQLNLGQKQELMTKGKRLADLTSHEISMLEDYNRMDTELCARLFKSLIAGFPKDEMFQIDMTTRMLVDPKFVLDYDLVRHTLDEVKLEKKRSLMALGELLAVEPKLFITVEEQVKTQLASSAKFAALLEKLGVDTPMKQSPTNPEKLTPALAKTDEAFIALTEHENEVVAAAAQARLEVKSTLLETRLQAFIRAADVCGGKLPIPLKYCGADTTGRWSGEQYNPQNLPRINPKKTKLSDALRNSLLAPPGYKIIVADLSGIELRVNHFLWKVKSSMDMYAQDPEADLYRAFAAARYKIKPEEVTKDQRQLAKVAQLGLGFGAGAPTFKRVAKLMGGLSLTDQESKEIVDDWRDEYYDIVAGWRQFQTSLASIKQGTEIAIDPWGMCVTEQNAVRLPSGRRIYYPDLAYQTDDDGRKEWWYGNGRHRARIYAGKGVENLVQALARDVIAGNALAFRKATGLNPALMVHDELVYVVPEADADSLLSELQTIMRTSPSWWPELVTWSEGDIAQSYGAAK